MKQAHLRRRGILSAVLQIGLLLLCVIYRQHIKFPPAAVEHIWVSGLLIFSLALITGEQTLNACTRRAPTRHPHPSNYVTEEPKYKKRAWLSWESLSCRWKRQESQRLGKTVTLQRLKEGAGTRIGLESFLKMYISACLCLSLENALFQLLGIELSYIEFNIVRIVQIVCV